MQAAPVLPVLDVPAPLAGEGEGVMCTCRPFPVLWQGGEKLQPGDPRTVPWGILDEEWVRRLHDQTLTRLAERGGLSLAEVHANLTRATGRQLLVICEMLETNGDFRNAVRDVLRIAVDEHDRCVEG